MAHSYTPGLTVTEHTTVRRRRMLSLPGSVLVAAGEAVRANQAVARAELPGKVYPLNLANQLGVAPDEIHEYLITIHHSPFIIPHLSFMPSGTDPRPDTIS